MELTKVKYSVADGIATICMDSPETLNALDEIMENELLEAFTRAEFDESAKVVIYKANGRAFSGGGDIKRMLEVMKEEPRNNELLNEGFAMPGRVVRQIRNVRKPVIAVLNGAVAGAAANIALWCDFRIASEDMVLLEAFVKIGLVTDGGGAYILTKIVGVAKATELIMTGKTIDSAECLRLGLVNEVVPNEELQERAIAFAKRFVKGPGLAYKHLKNLINISAFSDMGGYLDMEAELQRICGASEDVLEGMTAFVEKRKPVYKGK